MFICIIVLLKIENWNILNDMFCFILLRRYGMYFFKFYGKNIEWFIIYICIIKILNIVFYLEEIV